MLWYRPLLAFPEATMTPDERQEMNRLCLAIQQEKDPTMFSKLVKELNEFFERRERKLAEPK